jgi:hypothetical protein
MKLLALFLIISFSISIHGDVDSNVENWEINDTEWFPFWKTMFNLFTFQEKYEEYEPIPSEPGTEVECFSLEDNVACEFISMELDPPITWKIDRSDDRWVVVESDSKSPHKKYTTRSCDTLLGVFIMYNRVLTCDMIDNDIKIKLKYL